MTAAASLGQRLNPLSCPDDDAWLRISRGSCLQSARQTGGRRGLRRQQQQSLLLLVVVVRGACEQ